jgi:probable F420-dependent oxidoreductase
MKTDTALLGRDLADIGEAAAHLEALGYDGAYTFEGPNDPFFPLAMAARDTERVELCTAVAIAFARNPMLLANIGYDLQKLSKGRFTLGLGSQIRPHITRRFSMPWSQPALRMKEMVQAIKAIWRCWNEDERLNFEGEIYQHTLMTPMFNPGPNPYGNPKIYVAGVGPRMTEVAAEVADGFFTHPFHTATSWETSTLPALQRGVEAGGRSLKDIDICFQLMVVSGKNDEELEKCRQIVTQQVAFYGSTPAYRVTLESHGWGDLQSELNALSKKGGWVEMGRLITDEILEEIAVVGPLNEVADKIRARCGKYADRVSFGVPYFGDAEYWSDIARDLREGA